MKELFDLYLLFFNSHGLLRFTVNTEEAILWQPVELLGRGGQGCSSMSTACCSCVAQPPRRGAVQHSETPTGLETAILEFQQKKFRLSWSSLSEGY